MKVEPYLMFDGRCQEALDFYRKSIGAEVTGLMRFKECPEPKMCPAGSGEKVMHASFRVGDTTLMASDGRCEGRPNFQGISLTISVPDTAKAQRLFAALSDGGKVQMPLTKTFYSPLFGMVADRFGVSWMILTEAPRK